MTYTELIARIAQITHRSDLSGQMQNFVNDANSQISTRLSMSLNAPSAATEGADNAIFYDQPLLYLYASLVGAYEYINELDMAQHYYQRYINEIDAYYITASKGMCPTYVMGDATCKASFETDSADWILATGYWNDAGLWIDTATWND